MSWDAPARGTYTRALRFGEWIGEPVTPLFESWLLTAMEERLHTRLEEWLGQHAPRPLHVVVNGWYFYSLNWMSAPALARSLPGLAWRLLRSPRRVAGLMPATVRHSVPVFEREWRDDLLPRYRTAVARVANDVFFLTRHETLSALDGPHAVPTGDVATRRATHHEQARLVPPLFVGRINRMLRWYWQALPRTVGGDRSSRALVAGSPASPGRVTGTVRVIHSPRQFDDLQPGEILVAPLSAPAWTPLFTTAAAVVTDVGSAARHTSIIAREYGITAVVGCGDATARLRTGMRVTVNGATGNIELS